jgi:hypothetical protein
VLLLLLWAWILVGFELCIAWKRGEGMAAYLHSVGGGRSSANLLWVLFWILVSIVDVSQLPILPKK